MLILTMISFGVNGKIHLAKIMNNYKILLIFYQFAIHL